MKKLLFVIDSLGCGGAEKSLISLLNNLDYFNYQVDLLLVSRGGEFESYLPQQVNIIQSPQYFSFLKGKEVSFKRKLIYSFVRLKTSLKLRLYRLFKKNIHSEQIIYSSVQKCLDLIPKKYDVAIAYSQGFPTYFVSEKVKASKKMAWINCDYINTLYDKDFDYRFYKNIDKMIVVSDYIYDSVSKMKYNYQNKLKIIRDIVDPNMINSMSVSIDVPEMKEEEFNILTVGRLATVKGYDLAMQTAVLLKQKKIKFKWFIIGEGPQRKEIEQDIIFHNLEEEFILLGAKANPYPYMRNCDLYVQCSRKEGFGLTVMEARILEKVVITTNFNTAKELINDSVNGLIVNMDANSLANAIITYIKENNLFNQIKENIINEKKYSSISEVEKFYEEIA